MESKKFCLGEHFASYDDLKEKMKKYEEENLNIWTFELETDVKLKLHEWTKYIIQQKGFMK